MIILLINLIRLIQIIVFIRVLLTWIMPGRLPQGLQPIVAPIDKVLKVFQVLIKTGPGYLDLGPMLFLLLLEVIQRVLISALASGAIPAF